MLRLLGLVLAATVIIGFFAPELQKIADMPATSKAPAATPKPAALLGRAEIAADSRGHFVFTGRVNGRPLAMLADTGATLVALRASDAKAVGLIVLPGDYTAKVSTAGGVAEAARVRLQEIEVGGIRVTDVDALVLSDGQLATNLLGMSFLSRLNTFTVENGRLVLSQ
ncbi:retropepsin-like aspartic protease family protein [Pleomorphomonas oryzae]|uniref:retropepsin-like aspartic protease family protein n=1 Tax=Pleomorphomonas oryzae TaxID=261934 RepID=UPI000407ED0A|nr:TIGR02281 family clan AA aspartic protease [Pleomorphomonas oryzae]